MKIYVVIHTFGHFLLKYGTRNKMLNDPSSQYWLMLWIIYRWQKGLELHHKSTRRIPKSKHFQCGSWPTRQFTPAIKGVSEFSQIRCPRNEDEMSQYSWALRHSESMPQINNCDTFMPTSSTSAVIFDGKQSDMRDEALWTDVNFMRNLGMQGRLYPIIKVREERTQLSSHMNMDWTWSASCLSGCMARNALTLFFALILVTNQENQNVTHLCMQRWIWRELEYPHHFVVVF